MDFTLDRFTNRIIELFVNSEHFPESVDPYINGFGREEELKIKHKGRDPLHLKAIAESSMKSSMVGSESTITFDYGNTKLEKSYPHYHILQQAPVIRKAGYGTEKSKGSESGKSAEERDYEKVTWNGKTFTKEYSRNVRGQRVKFSRTTYWSGGKTSSGTLILRRTARHGGANQYLNIHLNYIDKALDEIVPILESEFGLKKGRKVDTGLGEEYSLQEESGYTTNIFDILNTHDIGE